MSNDLEIYCKLRTEYQSIGIKEEKEDFISFLRYCAECLEKGTSVQEIWNDYRQSIQVNT